MSAPLRPLPLLNQHNVLLPDGSVDPAFATDCGETCLAAVFEALRGLPISPGAVRSMLGLSPGNGSTTAANLQRWCQAVHLSGVRRDSDPGGLHHALTRVHRHKRYGLTLGYWQGPAELHWVASFYADRHGFSALDPWVGAVRWFGWAAAEPLSAGVTVAVRA